MVGYSTKKLKVVVDDMNLIIIHVISKSIIETINNKAKYLNLIFKRLTEK